MHLVVEYMLADHLTRLHFFSICCSRMMQRYGKSGGIKIHNPQWKRMIAS